MPTGRREGLRTGQGVTGIPKGTGGDCMAWCAAKSCSPNRDPGCEFRLLLRCWIGLPILPTGVTLPECPLCRESVDPFGDHLVCCEQNGCAARNNAFRNAFFAVCVQHGIVVEKEPECLAGKRTADVLLLLWTRGQHVAVDFVCTHPAVPAQYPLEGARRAKHCN